MKKESIKRMFACGVLALCCFFCLLKSLPTTAARIALALSPMSQRIILRPGETYRGGFTVANTTNASQNLNYIVNVAPFYQTSLSEDDNDDYGGVDYETKTNMNQIVDWITIDNPTGVVAPNNGDTVTFSIVVPNDAPAGGQYAAFLVGEKPGADVEENSVTVTETMQMAHIIYAEVAGETREEGAILSNNIPSFSLNGVIEATAMVRNDGNIHTDAEFILQVFPLFSDEEVCTNEEDATKSLIMPNTERYHTESCESLSAGIYRAKQTVKIFGETSVVEKTVIVCPIWLLFVLIFAIVATIIYFVMRSKSRKNSRKRTETQ